MENRFEFDLKLGVSNGSQILKHVVLLRANGVAEKVFLEKSSQHSWAAKVISMCVGAIDGFSIAPEYRKAYLEKGDSAPIPQIVLNLPLQEANTLLLEIHRRLWADVLSDQVNICTACGKEFASDIDLNKLQYSEKALAQIAEVTDSFEWFTLDVTLLEGFIIERFGKSELFSDYEGLKVNRFIFKTPTLGDAINHKDAEDEIELWRGIAYDCLTAIFAADENGNSVSIDISLKGVYGKDILFNQLLDTKDLQRIRKVLRDYLPTIAFEYKDTCPCPKKHLTSISLPLGSFFGD